MRLLDFFPLALFAISGFAHPGFDKHVAAISSHVNNIDVAINQYVNSGGSVTRGLVPMLKLRSECGKAIKALDKATADLTNPQAFNPDFRLTDAETRSMFNSFKAMEPVITHSHGFLTDNNAFTMLGVRTIFKRDLANLAASTEAFSKAIIKEAPADLLEEGTAIANRINDSFARAALA